MILGRELAYIDDRAHCYVFFRKTDVKAFDAVIIVTIFVCDQMYSILFDLGSSYSELSFKFLIGLNLVCHVLDYLVYMSTLVDESILMTNVFHSCPALFVKF